MNNVGSRITSRKPTPMRGAVFGGLGGGLRIRNILRYVWTAQKMCFVSDRTY